MSTVAICPACTQPLVQPNDTCSASRWHELEGKMPDDPIVLGWYSVHWNGGRSATCIHCGEPALLLDDAGRPAHKVCTEAALARLVDHTH
jgi:hypothetical protein